MVIRIIPEISKNPMTDSLSLNFTHPKNRKHIYIYIAQLTNFCIKKYNFQEMNNFLCSVASIFKHINLPFISKEVNIYLYIYIFFISIPLLHPSSLVDCPLGIFTNWYPHVNITTGANPNTNNASDLAWIQTLLMWPLSIGRQRPVPDDDDAMRDKYFIKESYPLLWVTFP